MNTTNEELTQRAKSLFTKYDSDKNNFIDLKELRNLLNDTAKEIGIPIPNEEDVGKVMVDTDKNEDKKISIEEFIKLYKILSLMKTESVK